MCADVTLLLEKYKHHLQRYGEGNHYIYTSPWHIRLSDKRVYGMLIGRHSDDNVQFVSYDRLKKHHDFYSKVLARDLDGYISVIESEMKRFS